MSASHTVGKNRANGLAEIINHNGARKWAPTGTETWLVRAVNTSKYDIPIPCPRNGLRARAPVAAPSCQPGPAPFLLPRVSMRTMSSPIEATGLHVPRNARSSRAIFRAFSKAETGSGHGNNKRSSKSLTSVMRLLKSNFANIVFRRLLLSLTRLTRESGVIHVALRCGSRRATATLTTLHALFTSHHFPFRPPRPRPSPTLHPHSTLPFVLPWQPLATPGLTE
jgi:hypothetical protein